MSPEIASLLADRDHISACRDTISARLELSRGLYKGHSDSHWFDWFYLRK